MFNFAKIDYPFSKIEVMSYLLKVVIQHTFFLKSTYPSQFSFGFGSNIKPKSMFGLYWPQHTSKQTGFCRGGRSDAKGFPRKTETLFRTAACYS